MSPVEPAIGPRPGRMEALGGGERRLYEWILRRFAAGGPPSPADVRAAAERFELDLGRALGRLAQLDLVHASRGEIVVAYPFSGRPTPHRVSIDGGPEVFAMCAIDALGIAPMLQLPVEILSRDAVSSGEVWVRLDPGDGAWWEPETAVVLDASAGCGGPSFRSCCGVLNFFESGENALRYLVAHPGVDGHAISLPVAIERGRAVFGDALKEL